MNDEVHERIEEVLRQHQREDDSWWVCQCGFAYEHREGEPFPEYGWARHQAQMVDQELTRVRGEEP